MSAFSRAEIHNHVPSLVLSVRSMNNGRLVVRGEHPTATRVGIVYPLVHQSTAANSGATHSRCSVATAARWVQVDFLLLLDSDEAMSSRHSFIAVSKVHCMYWERPLRSDHPKRCSHGPKLFLEHGIAGRVLH